ncbi:MAG: hypothetical protein ACI4QI_06015 [Candidatus Coproplasma sp.]
MNNTQLVVRHEYNQDVFDYLANIGFANVQNLTAENYRFPVIVVDLTTKTFFGTNTACMSAMKPKVLTFAELKELLKGN